MTRPNEYAEIQQDLTQGANTTVARPHQMGTTDYCAFVTQDISGGGAEDGQDLFFCPDAVGDRTSTSAKVYAFAGAPYDLMLVTPHSMLDVGPIAGQTRTLDEMYRRNNVYYRRPAYRSLHRAVNFFVVNKETTTFNPTEVIPAATGDHPADLGLLTHRLGTTDVAVFAMASTLPSFTSGPAQVPVRVFWQPYSVDAVSLYLATEDGRSFPVFPIHVPWTFDIMVVSRPAAGHSVVYHDNRSYSAGIPPLSKRPDYRALRRITLPGIKNPTALTHNDNQIASMLLFGYSQLEGVSGIPGVPVVTSRGTAGPVEIESSIKDAAGNGITNLDVLVVSPHSIFTSRVV